jgi:peptidoglycan/LPS O-acetylase OafA/YrhL
MHGPVEAKTRPVSDRATFYPAFDYLRAIAAFGVLKFQRSSSPSLP